MEILCEWAAKFGMIGMYQPCPEHRRELRKVNGKERGPDRKYQAARQPFHDALVERDRMNHPMPAWIRILPAPEFSLKRNGPQLTPGIILPDGRKPAVTPSMHLSDRLSD